MKKTLALCTLALVTLVACGTPSPRPTNQADESGVETRRDPRRKTSCSSTAAESVNGIHQRVKLEVKPCHVASGKTPKAILVNIGQAALGYGPGFTLERRTPRGWRRINRRQGFPLPLMYLHPGERSDPERIAVYFSDPEPIDLVPGVYRVTKGLQLTPGKARPPVMGVDVTFRIAD
jgi:hypothetical protein